MGSFEEQKTGFSVEPAYGRLSPAQEQLWFLHRLAPGDTSYNILHAAQLHGPLNAEALRAAVNEIIRRHEILRSRVVEVDGTPMLAVDGMVELPIPVQTISNRESSADDAAIQTWAKREWTTPFDLTRSPLLRIRLLRLRADDHALLVSMHHIAGDKWSMGIFVRELGTLYAAFAEGKPSPLPDLNVQYADYSQRYAELQNQDELQKAVEYWRQELTGFQALRIPTDFPRPAKQRHAGKSFSVALHRNLVSELRDLSRTAGCTLFTTLLCGFQIALHRCSGQDDVTVGTTLAGRTGQESEDLIGLFANAVPIRTRMHENPRIKDLLRIVKKTVLDARKYQGIAFHELLTELQRDDDASRHPLFDVMFTMHNVPGDEVASMPGLRVSHIEVESQTSKFDVTLAVSEQKDGTVVGWLEYDSDLLKPETAHSLVERWKRVLIGMADLSESRVGDLEILTAAERLQLTAWSRAGGEEMHDTVVSLFEKHAAALPQACAICSGAETVSYGVLNERAGHIASWLRSKGAGPECVVGVCLERSVQMIETLLAIWKAGAAYLPLDPETPQRRIQQLISSARAAIVLTNREIAAQLRDGSSAAVYSLDEQRAAMSECTYCEARPSVHSDNLAYVIYTSGSSGEPKGIAATHRGIVRLIRKTNYMAFDADQVFLHAANVAFDATTWEIWGALANGGRVAIVSREDVLDSEKLSARIREDGVTSLFLTTALFNESVRAKPEIFRGVRHVLVGGENANPGTLRSALLEAAPEQLVHVYGPTETVTYASYQVLKDIAESGPVPIGRPISNTEIWVLDRYMKLAPPGVAGEICIGGAGLARGYWEQAGLTAERFVANPFSNSPGARMYRTGDLGRWLPDGRLEILERLDRQVKIRGYRVEPSEIEAVLRRLQGIADACVEVREDAETGKYLSAFLVPLPEGHQLQLEAIRDALKSELPANMIPAKWCVLERLPLNPNGKIDRWQLPEAKPIPAAHPGNCDPLDAFERIIWRMWKELLPNAHIGRDANFFDIGGHSIAAVRLVSRTNALLGIDLGARDVFANPTPGQFARVARRSLLNLPSILKNPNLAEQIRSGTTH